MDNEWTEARRNDSPGMEPLGGDHRGYNSGGNIYINTNTTITNSSLDSSSGAVVENPRANAADPGWISAGRSHRPLEPQSPRTTAKEPGLQRPLLRPRAAVPEARVPESLCSAARDKKLPSGK